jgi:hypothetical protein
VQATPLKAVAVRSTRTSSSPKRTGFFFFLNDLLIWSSMLKKENLITEELAKLNKVVTFVKLGKE